MSRAEKVLYRFVNAIVGFVLRSPAHGLLSGSVVLISFAGQKSGRRYAVPLGYVLDTDSVVCFTGRSWSRWWKNLADDVPADMWLRGRDTKVRARVVSDEAEAARWLAEFLHKYPRTARRYGVPLDPEGRPAPGAVAKSARDDAVMIHATTVGGVSLRQIEGRA